MSVFGELRPTSINGLSNLDFLDTISATQVLASNLYTKAQTDALMAASTPAIEDGSLTIAKTVGLRSELDTINEIRAGMQVTIANTAASLLLTKDDVAALTSVVDTKASQEDLTNGLLTRATVSSLVAGLSSKQQSLDFASNVTVGALQAATMGVSGDLTMGSDYLPVY